MQSLEKVIALHENRIALAAYYRLPDMVWWVLYGRAVLAMWIGGYEGGLSGVRRFVGLTLATALAFSVVITLMAALDRPQHQLSMKIQGPMVDLQEDMLRSTGSQP
jgi:hypothetical protein